MTSITLYTRQGCPLCDEALAILGPLAKKVNAHVEVVDVDLDLELLEAYNDRVPVIVSEGRVIAEGIVNRSQLREALAGHSRR